MQFVNHEPPKDAVKWLSPLTRGLLRIIAQKTLSSMGTAISLHLLAVRGLQIALVIFTVLNMSWAKESADAGIAGLHEWEAARGVLGGEVDVDPPDVEFIKTVSNSIIQ